MESAKQHYQLQFPLIIAMRGPSNIKKREIAASLAQFLHYPLIDEEDVTIDFETSPSTSSPLDESLHYPLTDEEDITIDFEASPSTSSTNFSNESPFKIVTKITETQLQLKLQVIINSSLSQKTHVDHLSELADSTGAHLIIVHCTNGGANQDHDYEFEYAPVLSIDISKTFIVKDFAPAVIDAAIKFHEKGNTKPDNSQSQLPKAPAIPQRFFTESHVHEFSFTTEPKMADDSGRPLDCTYCQKPISGPTYKCVVCDDFILHKSCAELDPKMEVAEQISPFYAKAHPTEYSFPKEKKCKGCDHYSSDCHNCLLQTHIKCGILPTILAYDKHIHPLSFVIMPFWFNFEFKCFACNEYGKFISYKCYGCNIDLHISCAIPKFLVFFEGGIYSFDLEDMLRADAEVLGKGSIGTSYKAVLEGGITVVVKRLKDVVVSKKEFEMLIGVLGKIKHDNVVPLRAFYYSKDEKLLVYDFMAAGSLSALLHGSRGSGRTPLDWDNRKRIAMSTARGLAHLHVVGKVVHGNIKSSNILLRPDQDACISDFGLNPLFGTAMPPSRVAGYRAPEVVKTRKVTFKSDVYSFGVLLLELLTGKAPNHVSLGAEGMDLPTWVRFIVRGEWTAEVFDVELMRYHNVEEEMVQLLQIAMACVSTVSDQRPTMQEVVRMMEDINKGETD